VKRRKNDMMNGLTELELRWLESYGSKNTRRNYKRGWTRFKNFLGKKTEQILAERKADLSSEDAFLRKRYEREVVAFFNNQKEKGGSLNTAILMATAPRAFFGFFELPLRLKRGSIPQFVMAIGEHRLTLENLKAMFTVGDLRSRVIISMAKDMGIRISDFKKILKEEVRVLLSQTAPVEFRVLTRKETIIARTHLSEETLELLKVYIPTLSQENEYLFPSEKSCLNEDTINKIIQNLAEQAKIPLTGRLSFKCFRKLFLSLCSNLGISDWHSRIMCGKKVDRSILTYLNSIDLKADAKKIHSTLSITNHKKRLGNLEQIIERIGIAFAKKLTKDTIEQMKDEGLSGFQTLTREELDPMTDWKDIIQNYITFDEIIPPLPNRPLKKEKIREDPDFREREKERGRKKIQSQEV